MIERKEKSFMSPIQVAQSSMTNENRSKTNYNSIAVRTSQVPTPNYLEKQANSHENSEANFHLSINKVSNPGSVEFYKN